MASGPQHLGGPGRRHPGKHDRGQQRSRRRLNGVRLLAEFHALRRHDAAAGPVRHAADRDPGAPQFLLIADPSNPNGGLLERFNGFETTSGQTTVDQLNLPSLGIAFDGATPADDYITNIYSLEYDGFTDFPRYPINFLSDLNAFLGIAELHGTYLNGGVDGSGPTADRIANAILLPGSAARGTADSLTNYYMIDETAPLVSLLPTQLQELLGPDLTYLINLGYGDGSLGYSVTADSPANVPTPFGLFPDVSLSTVLSTLATDTEQGFQNLMSGTDPYSAALDPATSSATSLPDLLSALEADAANPAASFTDFVNALSSAASTTVFHLAANGGHHQRTGDQPARVGNLDFRRQPVER